VLLLIQALVLGLLQGLTEFLPVSSSGHLQGIPFLLGWDSGSLAFDVMVHAGTLLAVLWYFRGDLWQLAVGALGRGGVSDADQRRSRALVAYLAVASVPAAVAGLLFEDVFEAAFASPVAVALFLYGTALLLWGSERIRTRRIAAAVAEVPGPARARRTADAVEGAEPDVGPVDGDADGDGRARADADAATDADGAASDDGLGADADPGRDQWQLRGRDAVAIGVAQALAIFPGISRAGATMATGMALGLSRAGAARFSFLLSIPVIVGATVFKLPELGQVEPGALPFGPVEITVGVLAAALSGYWAIRTLIALVQRRDLLVFARYVVVFATLLLAVALLRG
jgi:undecaprenyl-diphosphatase